GGARGGAGAARAAGRRNGSGAFYYFGASGAASAAHQRGVAPRAGTRAAPRGGPAMRWAELSGRDRRAVLLGASILLPALFLVFGVRPYVNAYGEARDALAAERGTLARE